LEVGELRSLAFYGTLTEYKAKRIAYHIHRLLVLDHWKGPGCMAKALGFKGPVGGCQSQGRARPRPRPNITDRI